jgi:hypothetical protein
VEEEMLNEDGVHGNVKWEGMAGGGIESGGMSSSGVRWSGAEAGGRVNRSHNVEIRRGKRLTDEPKSKPLLGRFLLKCLCLVDLDEEVVLDE